MALPEAALLSALLALLTPLLEPAKNALILDASDAMLPSARIVMMAFSKSLMEPAAVARKAVRSAVVLESVIYVSSLSYLITTNLKGKIYK